MAQAEALARTTKPEDLATEIDAARAILTEDIIAIGYPEQRLVNRLADRTQELERR